MNLLSVKMSLPTVSDYSMLEKIGSGSYATVYKAFKKVRVDFSDSKSMHMY